MFGAAPGVPWVNTTAANEGYWLAQSLHKDTVVNVDDDSLLGFTRAQLVWSRTTPASTVEDVMSSHFDFATYIGGVVRPLSSADITDHLATINAWWTTMKADTTTAYTLREVRWYEYQPITPKPGPAVLVSTIGTAGTAGTARNADQLAATTTYKTASRKHWGRSYWPTLTRNSIDSTFGRLSSAYQTGLHGAVKAVLQDTGSSAAVCPVVASIQYTAVMGIRELQTDDVVDVIRRRRAKNPSNRLVDDD